MKQSKFLILSILSLIILVFVQPATANHFEEGEVLHVYAPSGLSLRSAPGIQGIAIDVIEFGQYVQVLNQDTEKKYTERIDWVEGEWILVEYNGQTGYVFDGFLSSLPLPEFDFELSYNDMELTYPLESWVNYHFDQTLEVDTIMRKDGLAKTVSYFQYDQKLVKTNEEGYFKMEVYLSDVRIMDVYHLLVSMLPSKAERATFYNKSIFIEDVDGDVNQVKINLDQPVYIQLTNEGKVKIKTLVPNHGCDISCC